MRSFVPVSASMDSGAYLKNQYHAPVVELADTLDLGSGIEKGEAAVYPVTSNI